MKKLSDFIDKRVEQKFQVYEARVDGKTIEVAVPIDRAKEFEKTFHEDDVTDVVGIAEILGGFKL